MYKSSLSHDVVFIMKLVNIITINTNNCDEIFFLSLILHETSFKYDN